jgi:hypothetical protein
MLRQIRGRSTTLMSVGSATSREKGMQYKLLKVSGNSKNWYKCGSDWNDNTDWWPTARKNWVRVVRLIVTKVCAKIFRKEICCYLSVRLLEEPDLLGPLITWWRDLSLPQPRNKAACSTVWAFETEKSVNIKMKVKTSLICYYMSRNLFHQDTVNQTFFFHSWNIYNKIFLQMDEIFCRELRYAS